MRVVLLAVVALLAVPAAASPLVTVADPVRVLGGHHDEAQYYYENNWLVLRKMAVERGYIHSFEILRAEDPPADGFDLLLITRFRDREQFAAAEENFQRLISERGPLRLLNDLTPGEFRESLGAHTGTSVTGAD